MGAWRLDGEKLKAARQRAALSMRDLEAASGVKLITIHRIETGKVRDAYPSTLRKLAAALHVEPMALMSEDSERGPV
jgi:transcriptional regulator with XRE-family HTH domain